MEITLRDVTYYAMGAIEDPALNRQVWQQIVNSDQLFAHYQSICASLTDAELGDQKVNLKPAKLNWATLAEDRSSISASDQPVDQGSVTTESSDRYAMPTKVQRFRDDQVYYDFDADSGTVTIWVTSDFQFGPSRQLYISVEHERDDTVYFSGWLELTERDQRWVADIPEAISNPEMIVGFALEEEELDDV